MRGDLSNFSFLHSDWPVLHGNAVAADANIYSAPRTCRVTLGSRDPQDLLLQTINAQPTAGRLNRYCEFPKVQESVFSVFFFSAATSAVIAALYFARAILSRFVEAQPDL